MRSAASQLVVMAAIVATLLYWPLGLVAALALYLAAIPFEAFLTFGGALNRPSGMLAWWLIVFVVALVYAAIVFPWDMRQDFNGPPRS